MFNESTRKQPLVATRSSFKIPFPTKKNRAPWKNG